MVVLVPVVLNRAGQVFEEVDTEMRLAGLLHDDAERSVEGVDEQRAVIDAALEDHAVHVIRDVPDLSLGSRVVRKNLLEHRTPRGGAAAALFDLVYHQRDKWCCV